MPGPTKQQFTLPREATKWDFKGSTQQKRANQSQDYLYNVTLKPTLRVVKYGMPVMLVTFFLYQHVWKVGSIAEELSTRLPDKFKMGSAFHQLDDSAERRELHLKQKGLN